MKILPWLLVLAATPLAQTETWQCLTVQPISGSPVFSPASPSAACAQASKSGGAPWTQQATYNVQLWNLQNGANSGSPTRVVANGNGNCTSSLSPYPNVAPIWGTPSVQASGSTLTWTVAVQSYSPVINLGIDWGSSANGVVTAGSASFPTSPCQCFVNDCSTQGVVALALRASDFVEAMDQEPLKVAVTAARYTLKIDDAVVGTFTKEEWAKGVNLATLPTPMAKQAAAVHDLTLRHNVIHFARWRLVEVNLQNVAVDPAHVRAAVDALDVLDADVIAQQRAAAQPKSHRYELAAE